LAPLLLLLLQLAQVVDQVDRVLGGCQVGIGIGQDGQCAARGV